MKKKIFISVGDPSADKHAAFLMKKLLEKQPDIEFIGIGGYEMEKIGFKSVVPISEISVTGFFEVAKKYTFFLNLLDICKQLLRSETPDLFLPIDYPGFNIRLAEYSKKIGIPVCYYIAPQLWAWGRGRANKLAECVEKLLVVFPFEEKFFQSYGINAKFIGHPLLDHEIFHQNIEKDENLIAFLPGSRKQEIDNHLKIFLETTKFLPDNFKFGFAKSSNIKSEEYDLIKQYKNVTLWDNSYELMQKAKIGLVKTGTSNLEAALLNMPFVMMYKTSLLTYYFAKNIINLEYISIVNILNNKDVVPELIQYNTNPKKIADALMNLLNADNFNNIIEEFGKIKAKLGTFSASEEASKEILKLL